MKPILKLLYFIQTFACYFVRLREKEAPEVLNSLFFTLSFFIYNGHLLTLRKIYSTQCLSLTLKFMFQFFLSFSLNSCHFTNIKEDILTQR